MCDAISRSVSHHSEQNQGAIQFSGFVIGTNYTKSDTDDEKNEEVEQGN